MLLNQQQQRGGLMQWVVPTHRNGLAAATGGGIGRRRNSVPATLMRTVFAVVLFLLFLVAALGDVAEAALLFAPTNVAELSLYQTVELRFAGNPLVQDPAIRVGDWFYFIPDASKPTCDTAGSDVTGNNFTVASADINGFAGTATISVKRTVFTAGSSYIVCYITNGTARPVRRGSSTNSSVLVWPSIYSSLTMRPTEASGGQGLVNITVTETRQDGRPVNSGVNSRSTLFLIPCSQDGADLCSSLDTLPQVCSRSPAGQVRLTNVLGAGTTSVTGSLTVPYLPAAGGYALCIPYCLNATVGCGTTVGMSYTVVTSTTTEAESVFVLRFGDANPGTYTVAPSAPQVREEGYMLLSGTDLSENDGIRVIRSDGACTSGSAALLSNLVVGDVRVVDDNTVNVSFVAPNLANAVSSGRVCYRRASGGGLWAAVYKSADAPGADFTIGILQPTGFTVVPEIPCVGHELSVIFTGTGLDSGTDDAFLTSAEKCDASTAATTFPCTLTEGNSPVCQAVVDPLTNDAMTLQVCYRKAGRANYAQVSGNIMVRERNPVFSLAQYPLYAGQKGVLTFVGKGLSLNDTVSILNNTETCGTGSPVSTFSLANGVELEAGTTYQYDVVGAGAQCLKICYRISGKTEWTVARPRQAAAASPSCPAQDLYIRPFSLRYTFQNGAPSARETVRLTLTLSRMAVAVKLVRSTNDCVVSFCGTTEMNRVPACELAWNEADFASDLSGTAANIVVGAPATSYIVCAASVHGDGDAYVPVLPKEVTDDASTAFAFTSSAANPVLQSRTPSQWRVAYAFLSTTFTGAGLNSSSDRVYAIMGSALMSVSARACLPAGVEPPRALLSSIQANTSTTETVAEYTRSERMYSGAEVHFCYLWSAGRRVTYAGSIPFLERLPSEMNTSTVPTGGFRAGAPITLNFSSNTTSLQAETDILYFFRFPRASNPTANCYCGSTCPPEARVDYDDAPLRAGASAAETQWTRPSGFDNYGYNALYVVCYDVAGSGNPTYMGRLSVGMAQPTYYTATSTGGENRVGRPITIRAVQECLEVACRDLSSADAMRLVPITTDCSQINDDETDETTENIGDPTVSSVRYTQRVVVNVPGEYHLCYRLDGMYGELPYSKNYTLTPLRVGEADPVSFSSVPEKPSAGMFLTVQLQCTNSACLGCVPLRLVPGVMASCWVDINGTFTSDRCITTTTVTFPNQFVPQGQFTVCYGIDVEGSRRIPGTFTVGAANPASFSSSFDNIYVNQASDVTMTVLGTGLEAGDQIFLLTSIGFTCHDLQTDVLNNNATLTGWFLPSVEPNPLQIDSTGATATWVASNRDKRFGTGLLFDPTYCDTPGVSCMMQLCYMRSGSTWAPVPINEPPNVTLLPADPSRASFDRTPLAVGMYTTVTVTGRALTAADVLTVRLGTCEGEAVTVSVGTATVTNDGTEWRGVVRFTGGVETSSFTVCYTRESSTTEIAAVDAAGQPSIIVAPSLYYIYSADNFTADHVMTQYEELIVGATFSTGTQSDLVLVDLIDAGTECNYMPYYNATGISPEFDVRLNMLGQGTAPYYAGRLAVPAGDYALCMEVDIGLFRVTTRGGSDDSTAFTVATVNPVGYTSAPTILFPNQPFNLTFSLGGDGVGTEDVLQIINGTLYDCGSGNATYIADHPLVEGGEGTTVQVSELMVPASLIDTRLTVCYRRTGGTFATVPRGTFLDQSLSVMQQIPRTWTAFPTQPQAGRTLRITFLGDAQEPEFLQATDRASLIRVTDDVEPACDQTPTITSGALVRTDINTLWSVSANETVEGTYILCYTSTANGAPVRVADPLQLSISALQSPTGAFKNVNEDLIVFSGERFYLMFDTNVLLNPVLSFSTEAETRDAVLFSRTNDCESSLTVDDVAIIPEDFNYSAMNVTNPSGIMAPYLHLVIRTAPGDYVVCMRRFGRTEGEAFFTYEVIGDLDAPATITVTAAPITAYTTVPTSPRAWVPSIEVTPTYGTGYTAASFVQLFFTLSNASDFIDDCYRPRASEAVEAAVLLNTTLQVLLETSRTQYPFPSAGDFQLCLQLEGNSTNTASVHIAPLGVLNPSPTAYIVPDVITVGEGFTMAFRALDPIFNSTVTENRAQLFVADEDVVADNIIPNCVNGQPPSGGGTTSFNTFTPTNTTYATVEPSIMVKGYFYVCFNVEGQVSSFPVPNAEGGFVFSVGLTGAQSYVVAPSPAYMGQQLVVTILGNALSSADHVKIVDVTNQEEGGTSYDGACTASAANADAEETNGEVGSNVIALSTAHAQYTPRVNATGRFVLCYQSSRVENTWVWVSDLHNFTVGTPHPVAYLLQPSPAYATEVDRLTIIDDATTGLLGAEDSIKLVDRGAGEVVFDCSEAAAVSNGIGAIARVDSESNNTVAVYQVCAVGATSVTVCYLLANGTWAEVPLRLPPPTYLYEPVVFRTSPFGGPTASPASPRPYEPFTLTFTSSDTAIRVRYLRFALAPQEACTLDPPYVEPVYYEVSSSDNTFEVALPQGGEYQLYLGAYESESDPFIAHSQIFTVAACDPCSFTPSYTFVGNNVSVTFPSSSEGFGVDDRVRIVPVTQGATGHPCDDPQGSFADVTLSPNANLSNASSTTVTVVVGTTDAFLGDYYMCYRKATDTSNYAIVTGADAAPLTFSIYPALPTNADLCPVAPSYLETVGFNFTFPSASYPKLSFSEEDEFLLLPPNVACGSAESVTAADVIHPVLDTPPGNDVALWVSTLPYGYTTTNYTLCFRLAGDAIARVVPPSVLAVTPQDPVRVVTQPPFITPDTEAFTIFIYGTQLAEEDEVHVVDASQRCNERCGERLSPTPLPAAVYTTTFRNNTLLELGFSSQLGTDVALAVCYRRADHPLVRLAVYYVGARNPTSYNTSFTPRIGTRPLMTFLGTGLTASDRVMIVNEGVYCDESLAVARGAFHSVAPDGEWSSFNLTLVGSGVVPGPYSVCYRVANSYGYAQMEDALVVQAGGPTSYATSNTPMEGRATVVTFDDDAFSSTEGDEAIIACAGCSCFDGTEASLPYGVPRISATEGGAVMSLRIGMEDDAPYAVCYRVSGSGFAQVGAEPIRPVSNSPAAIVVTPDPTLQGQRLMFNLTDYASTRSTSKALRAPSLEDWAMLVAATRLCWDTDTMNGTGILAGPAAVTAVTETNGTWLGHVPSLGPGAWPPTSFPISYALCYRESGQQEYVMVPFPSSALTMGAADPANYTTTPRDVASGTIDITMAFQDAAEGDTAFIVSYAGDTLATNRACDDNTSVSVWPMGPAYPSYAFSLPPGLTAESVVVCYVRVGATVAEVPQELALGVPNPSGYATSAVLGNELQREYITITFTGTGLDPTADNVVFTEGPCAEATTRPPASSAFVRRVSGLAATENTPAEGASVTLVVQFVNDADVTAHVCYQRGDVWSEVGTPLSLRAPIPTNVTLRPAIGVARAGQRVQIDLAGSADERIANAAVIAATDTSEESWCHNFTSDNVQEPLLRIVSASLLDVPTWQTPGAARVCVQKQDSLWADVAPTASGSAGDVYVDGPNPSSMRPFPNPPRVGQKVQLTFQLVIPPTADDKVRISLPTVEEPCESATPLTGFPSEISVVVVNATAMTSRVTLVDSTDALKYRSFNTSGSYKVCYYSATESVWGVVGGSLQTGGAVAVQPMAPQTWEVADGVRPTFFDPFVLVFDDNGGKLNATGDLVWAAPPTQSCGIAPEACPQCIVFALDVDASSAKRVRTQATTSVIVGTFNLCYRLRGATAALLSDSLQILPGEVECLEEGNVRVGMEQNVTFRKRSGVEVDADSWRVSFFGTTASDCGSGYVPDFVEGRARLLQSNDTTVLYGVEWPVSMVAERYLICYTHNGVARPVCTCGQINAQTGECFVSTVAASPLYFTPMPNPTYVGQSVQLALTLDDSMTSYPPESVKFVEYVDALTICSDEEAFPVVGGSMTNSTPTTHVYAFKHEYTLGASTLIVCALMPGLSNEYARVGTINPANSSNTLVFRPYLRLSTFPSDANLIRAMQTLRLTFTHASSQADDVVGVGDRITFVSSPSDCVESTIEGVPAEDVLDLFELEDTSFTTNPALVIGASNTTRSSYVYATFNAAEGQGTRYMCYKLDRGTWAPVLPRITVLSSAVTSCVQDPPTTSPGNGDDTSMRAMQYVRGTIISAEDTNDLYGSNDSVRVVFQTSPCFNDTAAVFLSGVSITNVGNTSVVAFAPTAGVFKVCYRFGGVNSTVANWSPMCLRLTFTEPSPSGSITGCLRLGQTLSVATAHRTGFRFTSSDRFRFVAGTDQCIYADGTKTVATSITVGDATQTTEGTSVNTDTANYVVPPALLGSGSTSLRLCYGDAAGNQFAVPLDASRPSVSEFGISARLIASALIQDRVTAGQRVLMTFLASNSDPQEDGSLVPYEAVPPQPYVPGPPYNGAFDVATALFLSPSVAYREGRCYVANAAGSGVYGNSTQTLGSFDPTQGGQEVVCYRSMGCSVEDVGAPLRIGGYNPATWGINPSAPRRGQLISLSFARNEEDDEAVPLSPGSDRGAAQPGLSNCWILSDTDGGVVEGTPSATSMNGLFFAAQEPSASSSSRLRVCYKLDSGSWSEIPNNLVTLQPANPTSFTVLNGAPRVMQQNFIEFSGTGLSAQDSAKIIAQADSCSEASVPPSDMVSYAPITGNPIPGTANGWGVVNATSTRSILTISTTTTGTYSVCYRLAEDGVWTLVYGDLNILSRDPEAVVQTPESPLEGELFTLNFTSANESSSMSRDDRIALYTGIVSCLAPSPSTDVIVTSPSRTDTLPPYLPFQLAAGTRGNHTLCYWKGDSVIIWGFDIVVIGANPSDHSTWPAAASLRANQLISLVFQGAGLLANQGGKSDEVKLIASTSPQTDEACQVQASAADVMYYALVANGTHAVQVVRSPPSASGSYWVCYKLNGGQYHTMLGDAMVLGAADPSAATSSKGNVLWDGEMTTWTIESSAPPVEGAFVFYSTVLCNDFPYYEVPNPSTDTFPNGVALVQNGVANLRLGHPANTETALSLCYYANSVITIVGASTVGVIAGSPPPLGTPLTATAMQIFQFNLSVTPTPDDYVVLVADPDKCVGQSAPSPTDDAFVDLQATPTDAVVTTAVAQAGTFYICYSNRVGSCAVGSSRECARTVDTVVVSPPNPSGWSMTPATIYTTDLMELTLLRPSGAAEPTEGENLWLAPVSASTDTPTMRDYAWACMQPMTSDGRIVLERNTSQTDVWTARLNVTGVYALCYAAQGETMPTIFPPASRGGPVVRLTEVNSATFSVPPTVGVATSVILHGRGLSQEDQLTAVGVPNAANIPEDICNNAAYTPQVPSESSSDGYGLSSMVRRLQFLETGKYVLCFKAAVSPGPMLLITPNSFDVSPTVMSFRVVSVALMNTPLHIEFTGEGLRETDLAALVNIGEGTGGNADICTGGVYSAMSGASDDGITSLYTTLPTELGTHAVCYMKVDAIPMKLAGSVEVSLRTATTAVFSGIPQCTALTACSPQPVLTLVDGEGQPTSDEFATVVMHLKRTDGSNVDELLSGGSIYTHKNYSIFYFLTATISTAGEYIMEANFTFRGGVTFVVESPTITVAAASTPQPVSRVSCQPVGIIERSLLGSGASDTSVNITCIIQVTSPTAPTEYNVQINAGTSTPVVPGGTSGGFPFYTFTVVPPHDQPIIQFVSIVTTTAPPSESWPVANSPVIVRIGSQPQPGSTLSCESTSAGLPSPTMVRVGANLTCHAQGKRVINGVEWSIVAMPKYLQIFRETDDDSTSNTAVPIGDYPESLNGEYIFNVGSPALSRTVSVLGSVPSGDGSNVYVPMRGSPSRFMVIGEPQPGDTTISCVSANSASVLWFTPVEPFTCTLSLHAEGRPVNGVSGDFHVTMEAGGSTQPMSNSTWGTSLIIRAAAPPIADSSVPGASSDQVFGLRVTFVPLQRDVAHATGTLVYVTSLNMGGGSGNRVSIVLTGSGLSLDHKYGVRSSQNCTAGVESEASVAPVNGAPRSVRLEVAAREDPFYLCFAPSDQQTRWQILTNDVLNYKPSTGGVDKWTALLIVGVIFLFILLVLLIVLIWRVCMYKRRSAVAVVDTAVYLPPRANDRFVRRPGSFHPPPPPPPPPPPVVLPPKSLNSQVRININDRTMYGADLDTGMKVNEQMYTDAPVTLEKTANIDDGKAKLYENLSSDGSTPEGSRVIPPVPPPKPPSDDGPVLIGAVTHTSQAHVTANNTDDPRSGPYQHLHHKERHHPLQVDAPPPVLQPKVNKALSPASPVLAAVEDASPPQSWVGPFLVKGHTSRPLVNSVPSTSSTNKTQEKKTL